VYNFPVSLFLKFSLFLITIIIYVRFVLIKPNGLATELRAESPSAPVACSPAAWRADKRTQSPARSPDRHAVGRTINELQDVLLSILRIIVNFVK
jgi:hypothetical protein